MSGIISKIPFKVMSAYPKTTIVRDIVSFSNCNTLNRCDVHLRRLKTVKNKIPNNYSIHIIFRFFVIFFLVQVYGFNKFSYMAVNHKASHKVNFPCNEIELTSKNENENL